MPVLNFLAANPLLTLMLVLALGALFGQIKFGPLQFGAAGALLVGLVVGMVDPRFAQGLSAVKSLGVVLFSYTIGLATGGAFRSDLKRQWKLMCVGVASLIVMGFTCLGLGRLVGLSNAHVAGAFAGVLTSPAINDAIAVTGGSPDTLAGYALAYPTGVVVGMVIVAFTVGRRWPGRKDTPSLAEAGLQAVTTRVDRECAVDDLPGWCGQSIRMSYLQRAGATRVVSQQDRLMVGDKVLIVGDPTSVAAAVEFVGHPSSHDLTIRREHVDYRRFLVSNAHLAGTTLGSLDFEHRFSGVITRVRRNDLDLLAKDELVLQPGDRVLAVVPRERLGDVQDFFGDSERGASQVNALSLGLGVALGILVGVITIPLGGGIRLSLGMAAGPLVVGMFLGAVHKTGPLRWDLPHAVGATIRQVSLMLFLACIGLATGPGFIAQGFSPRGLLIITVSAVGLCLGAALLYLGARLLQLSAQRATGAFTGYVGQPALLNFANSRINDERIDSAYGALMAIGTVAKILLVQVIALL